MDTARIQQLATLCTQKTIQLFLHSEYITVFNHRTFYINTWFEPPAPTKPSLGSLALLCFFFFSQNTLCLKISNNYQEV
jgi:hypothetical protein